MKNRPIKIDKWREGGGEGAGFIYYWSGFIKFCIFLSSPVEIQLISLHSCTAPKSKSVRCWFVTRDFECNGANRLIYPSAKKPRQSKKKRYFAKWYFAKRGSLSLGLRFRFLCPWLFIYLRPPIEFIRTCEVRPNSPFSCKLCIEASISFLSNDEQMLWSFRCLTIWMIKYLFWTQRFGGKSRF